MIDSRPDGWYPGRRVTGGEDPGADEGEHEQAQHHPVDDERREAAAVEVAQQPGDDDQPDAEGEHRGQDRGPPGDRLPRHAAGQRLVDLEEARRQDGGDGEQERVPGRGGPRVAEEQAHGDRATGAGDAGDQCHGLGEPEGDAVPDGQLVQFALPGAHPVGPVEDQGEGDQRDGDDAQVAEGGLDAVLEQQPEDPDRDGAGDDQPAHPGVGVAAQLAVAERARPRR
jgi:hypothetical protein